MRMRLLLVAVLLLAGCAGQVTPAPQSYALPDRSSALAQRVDALAARQQAGTSGFRLLAESEDAFTARMQMIRQASTSLDVQYYIVHDGLSTRALVDEVLHAADRGVRVRLLLDDMTSDGSDYQIATLAAHPNVLIRVFNPLHLGRSNVVTRSLGRLLHLSQQHRRMHNKLMLADSSLAIVGGRNLGDEYFDADQAFNFTDIDLLAAGPVAEQLAVSFDQYWNHQLSVPIQQFLRRPPSEADLMQARDDIRRYLEAERLEDNRRYQHLMGNLQEPLLTRWMDDLIWAPAQALWDHPDKIEAPGVPDEKLLLTTQLQPSMDRVRHSMTLISAYFVPTEQGVEYLAEHAGNGVSVQVLTNALEATDVPAVHGGYAPYRADLLKAGVRLFELRRQPDQESRYSISGDSESSLHSKAAVFDQQEVFLGSLNFDPRSILWNTEVGILIDSEALASDVYELVQEGTSPAISYEVRLVERDGKERLIWLAEDHGQRKVLLHEPGGAWRRFNAWFSRIIGLERLL
ncbi:phospholipase D family protein [Stutzerimonas zhaodongensis]|uniref:Phospholipase D family protein n=1 Tax=Stutzerimonas zhaodongensis TaxID=1176257 RepID=A0A3M2HS11_9GAMM|nr:phospholipase D family protein [Stutzerimonas zhaodongensis]MCQ4316537.1 phospholipase D family protein [Stutzerimonas zhaodongensis]RMH88967.1 phospholipase D family protein [Stutzerimonas zhaodongensis]